MRRLRAPNKKRFEGQEIESFGELNVTLTHPLKGERIDLYP